MFYGYQMLSTSETVQIEQACKYQSEIHPDISWDKHSVCTACKMCVYVYIYLSSENGECSGRPIKKGKEIMLHQK